MSFEEDDESGHGKCTLDECAFPAWNGTEVVLPGARKQWLPGCPQLHVGDVAHWLSAYGDWKTFGQTPVQLGLVDRDELHPGWFEAMRFIDTQAARISRQKRDKPSGE